MGAGYSIKARADTAEVYIYEDVGEDWFGGVSAKQFADDLKALGSVSQIDVRLNSFGGEVFAGLAIYNQLKEHPARVVSHVDGIAASIASVIAMAGDEIRIAEAGFLMIHNASGFCIGEARDMRRLADILDTTTGAIADVYTARTGVGHFEVRDLMDAETWFTGPDAVAKGFADSVVENMRIAAHADLSAKHKFHNMPTALTGVVPLRPRALAEPRSASQVVAPASLAAARQQLARMQARLTLGARSA